MTLNRFSLLPLAAALILSACSGGKRSDTGTDQSPSPLQGLKPLYHPVEAHNFAIDTVPELGATVITIKHPWQGAEDQSRRLLLLPPGAEAPEGYTGDVIDHLPERIVAMSSTNVAMLNAVGALDRLVGVSGIDFISTPDINRDRVVDVGNQDDPDYEKLLALNPDLVLIYGIDSPSGMEERLAGFKIPSLYIPDYIEQSPLGKAEWTVVMAHLAGRRDMAIEQFAATRARYNELKASVDSALPRPTVMLNAPYGDIWYMPPVDSYMVRLINDAGADYIFADNQSDKSEAIGDEKSIEMLSQSDVWLNPGSFTTMADLRASLPRHGHIGAAASGRVYNNNLRSTPDGGNDFFESGALHPDIVLEDLIEIFHPDSHGYSPSYFYRLK